MENFRLLRVLHGSSAGCTGPQTAIAAQLATPACIAPEQKCSPAVEHSTYKTCDSFTNIPNIASSLYASAPFIILKNGCESPSLALVSTLQYVYPFNTCFLNPAPYLLNTADSIVSMTITMDGGAVTVKSFADQYCEVASITNATVRLSNLPQKLDKGAFESPCFAGSFPYGVQFDLYNGDSLLSANSVTSTTEISSGDILQSQPPPLTSNISVQLPSNSTASGASGPSTPLLVGIAVAVFALVLFVVTLLLCRRTRNRTKTYSNSTEMLSKSASTTGTILPPLQAQAKRAAFSWTKPLRVDTSRAATPLRARVAPQPWTLKHVARTVPRSRRKHYPRIHRDGRPCKFPSGSRAHKTRHHAWCNSYWTKRWMGVRCWPFGGGLRWRRMAELLRWRWGRLGCGSCLKKWLTSLKEWLRSWKGDVFWLNKRKGTRRARHHHLRIRSHCYFVHLRKNEAVDISGFHG
ncbi:hypothetical protein BC830DRAFT_1112894 [Chytriomyces sp. MP71]|nr:hypothetical protein BC830DRAFT_1112894 [Chytriomyces sp. MP71]